MKNKDEIKAKCKVTIGDTYIDYFEVDANTEIVLCDNIEETQEIKENTGMGEIEKLYKNAGVKKEVIPCPAKYYGYDCTRNNWDDEDCSCDIEGYPPFTTNKQILLIQWLLDKTDLYLHRNKSDFTYSIATGDIAVNKYKDFKESIAELINAIWQSLTEAEQNEIKNILK